LFTDISAIDLLPNGYVSV